MKILSLLEVCEQLKITTQTGRNRLSRGAPMPPSFRAGRKRLFRLEDVENWINDLAESGGQPLASNSDEKFGGTK